MSEGHVKLRPVGTLDQSVYGSGPAVFDCFLFHDELDLLELRLGELWDSVDRFILVESTSTFSGNPKPLHFSRNRERFAPFASKLTALVFDDPNASKDAWQRRKRQCNALMSGLASARSNDIVLLSDVDEIVSPDAIAELRLSPPATNEVVCFELRMFNYFLNLEIDEPWLRSGPRAARFGSIRTMERLRKVHGPSDQLMRNLTRAIKASNHMGRRTRRRVLCNAGWHFSYVGGEQAIMQKLRSYAAHDKVPPELLDPIELANRIRERRSISKMGSGHMRVQPLDETFPSYLRANQDRFLHLIAQVEEEG